MCQRSIFGPKIQLDENHKKWQNQSLMLKLTKILNFGASKILKNLNFCAKIIQNRSFLAFYLIRFGSKCRFLALKFKYFWYILGSKFQDFDSILALKFKVEKLRIHQDWIFWTKIVLLTRCSVTRDASVGSTKYSEKCDFLCLLSQSQFSISQNSKITKKLSF